MSIARTSVIAIAAFLLAALPLASQTLINDDITVNTTWSASGNPYQIVKASGRVLVPKGVTLTIEPGVVIEMLSGVSTITVKGQLIASGTASQKITFTRAVSFLGNWHSIEFEGIEGEGHGMMEYCAFDHGGSAMSPENFDAAINCLNGASPIIRNCTFTDCENGIYCTKLSNPTIQNCTFTNSVRYGVYIHNSSPDLLDNAFTGNGLGGILVKTEGNGATYPHYSGNTFGANDKAILQGAITQSGMWENPGTPYSITGEQLITQTATLSIEAGTTFEFTTNASKMAVRGKLIAEGTPTKKITFTRASSLADKWLTIDFYAKESNGSRLVNCIVEHSGFDPGGDKEVGAIQCLEGAETRIDSTIIRDCENGIYCRAKSNATIANSTITACARYGVFVLNSSPSFTNNTITGNTLGGIYLQTTPGLESYPTYSGNTFGANDRIVVRGNIERSGTWRFAATPYLISEQMRIEAGATFTVEPGVILQFLQPDNKIIVTGKIHTAGEAGNPVTFTRAPEFSGTWSGIQFTDANTNASLLAYAVIEYCGDTLSDAAIECISEASPTVSHCTIRNCLNGIACFDEANPRIDTTSISGSASFGVYCVNASPKLTGNTITGNAAGGVYVLTNGSGKCFPSYDGNAFGPTDYIVPKGNIVVSGTWEYAATPYVFDGVQQTSSQAALTIEKGVDLYFMNENAGFIVTNGSVNAVGTSSERIRFMRHPDSTHSWGSLFFRDAEAAKSVLDYVIVQDGGFNPFGDQQGGMLEFDKANVTVRNSSILRSKNTGISCKGGSKPTVVNCTIAGNTRFGMYSNHVAGAVVTAQSNWWGHASGPLDLGNDPSDPTQLHNPNGQGDKVSDYIDYSGWLTAPASANGPREAAQNYFVSSCYPNPFAASTAIEFTLSNQSLVILDVYDEAGKLLAHVANTTLDPGHHVLRWNGTDSFGQSVGSGTYYYTISAEAGYSRGKMSLVR